MIPVVTNCLCSNIRRVPSRTRITRLHFHAQEFVPYGHPGKQSVRKERKTNIRGRVSRTLSMLSFRQGPQHHRSKNIVALERGMYVSSQVCLPEDVAKEEPAASDRASPFASPAGPKKRGLRLVRRTDIKETALRRPWSPNQVRSTQEGWWQFGTYLAGRRLIKRSATYHSCLASSLSSLTYFYRQTSFAHKYGIDSSSDATSIFTCSVTAQSHTPNLVETSI